MFHAVRESLAAALPRRGKRLAGLFAFEFVVVLLGVLAAQVVQNWAREREVRRETLEARQRLERGYGDAIQFAAVWTAAMPCLRERVGEIMRHAATGTPLPDGFAGRPFLPRMVDYSETPQVNGHLAELIGEADAGKLTEMPERIGLIYRSMTEMGDRWETFRLLDPAFGPVGQADRTAARVAGADILSSMRSLDAALSSIERLKGERAATQRSPYDPVAGILPVRGCAEVWANGTAYRKLDPGEPLPY